MSSNIDEVDASPAGGGDAVDASPFSKSSGAKVTATPTAHIKPIQVDPNLSDEYSMDHAKRGIAVIVNNHTFEPKTKMPPRGGTDKDAASLKALFTEFGFEVFLFKDANTKMMQKILHDASKIDHSDSDCFCMVVLSHGEEGVIYATDGTIQIDDLFEPFKGNKCVTLVGKPKLFFIQACRGTRLDDGVEFHDGPEDMPDSSVPKIPAEADFLMAYSVVPGYFSWRNSQCGSWFIQALSAVLQKHGATMDLMSIMTRVNRKVAYEFQSNASQSHMNKKKQIPCITSMLTKDVIFRPKSAQ